MLINTLSILIPCYNEKKAIGDILQKVVDANCGLENEIIIVTDYSTDNSKTVIEQFIQTHMKAKKQDGRMASDNIFSRK